MMLSQCISKVSFEIWSQNHLSEFIIFYFFIHCEKQLRLFTTLDEYRTYQLNQQDAT